MKKMVCKICRKVHEFVLKLLDSKEMDMRIFTVLCIWSNTDPDACSFDIIDDAIEYAKNLVATAGWPEDAIEINEHATIYGASLGEEGDHVLVRETMLYFNDSMEDTDNG